VYRDATHTLAATVAHLEAELDQTRAMGSGQRARERVLVAIAAGSALLAAVSIVMAIAVSGRAEEQRDRHASLRAELERAGKDQAACRADNAAAFEKERGLKQELQDVWEYNETLSKTLRELPLCPARCQPPAAEWMGDPLLHAE
jgi:hypothetical protein